MPVLSGKGGRSPLHSTGERRGCTQTPEGLSCSLSSQIYCTGNLLRQVQMNQLFSEDKHFVDMPLKGSPGEHPALGVGSACPQTLPGLSLGSKTALLQFLFPAWEGGVPFFTGSSFQHFLLWPPVSASALCPSLQLSP